MKKIFAFKPTFLSLLVSAMGSPQMLQAAPLDLAQYPAGTASRQPAPNVIVSVDDSGSMGTTGITALKDALKQTFSANNIPDGRVRLAWQSMNRCSGISNMSSPCSGNNTMKPLEGTILQKEARKQTAISALPAVVSCSAQKVKLLQLKCFEKTT